MPAMLARRASGVRSSRPGFEGYQDQLIHSWCGILAILGTSLYPLFFVLDVFTMPPELLPRFAWYRGAAMAEFLIHFVVTRRTTPSSFSSRHGSKILPGLVRRMTTKWIRNSAIAAPR